MIHVESGSKIAVLSDIHGNTLAMEAVLADIEAEGGVDAWWFLGDYAAIGYDPVGSIELIRNLPEALFIRGNTDRYLAEGVHPWWHDPDILEDPNQVALYVRVGRSFAWSTGAVASGGQLSWIQSLPLEFRAELPDGTRVLGVHARPGMDDGFGIHPNMTQDEMEGAIAATEADLLLLGHVHFPQDHVLDDIRIVNTGGVSNPLPPDLRAKYAILTCEQDSHQIEFHQVEYDRGVVIEESRQRNHPAWEYIAKFMKGERYPDWMEEA